MTQSQTHATSHEPITFYSKTGCPWCNAVRHMLNEHDVAYKELDVLQDAQQHEQLKRETGQDKTPTLKIGSEWLKDTDAKEVAKRLGLPEPAEVKMAS